MMVTQVAQSAVTVALVGNPNTGKSTVFNALCGMNQRVGNYPGVTVEKKLGRFEFEQQAYQLIDLPGTYSLAPKSPDEIVALKVLLGLQPDVATPDVIVCIVDANNLERNLFLVSQITDLGIPVVLALNMIDVAKNNDVVILAEPLSRRLDVPIVEIQANRKKGLDELKRAISEAHTGQRPVVGHQFPDAVETEIDRIREAVDPLGNNPRSRFLAQRLLLDGGGLIQLITGPDAALLDQVNQSRQSLSQQNIQLTAVESISRYQNIQRLIHGVVKHPAQRSTSLTDRLDWMLTHKLWGSLAFFLLMMIIFQAIFSWAEPVMNFVDGSVSVLGELVAAGMPPGALRSLLVNGVIAGVGSVIIFLPQIFILFLFIGILEDCGYMARAAYLMDKLMSRVGLSGKSFIPLLSSFACAIPGIMATRVIENHRDRLITMLLAPLMSCSARLPIYILLIAAFVPNLAFGWFGLQAMVMLAMYLVGVLVAIPVAWILRKTLLTGETPPFVMELPEYKFPSITTVMRRTWEQGMAFLRRAGTVIFAVAIVVWALSYFPHPPGVESSIRDRYAGSNAGPVDKQVEDVIGREVASAYLQQSLLARMGRIIEPAVRPLGWDWKVASAVIASFPAREVVVGTLGVLYSVGEDADEGSTTLREKLRSATWNGTDRKVFNLPVALGLMVFFALCAQCVSTLVVMAKETGGYRWPVFTFVYMTTLAYLGALVTYQVGMMFM